MRKYLFILILTLSMILTGCPDPYEDTLQWELIDGVLYLDDPDAPVSHDEYNMHPICYQEEWNDLRDEIKTAVIGETIRSIGADTFKGLYNLHHVQWHDEIFYIGDSAFAGTSLELETFPANLTHIGSYAFQGCTLPEAFSIPNHIEEIGGSAFAFCKGIKHLIYTPGLSNGMFSNCESLETVQLPQRITKIPSDTFYGCSNLKTINIPDSVMSIGHAFQYCTSLEEIALPEQIESISGHTFEGCTSLKTIHINPNLKVINEKAFMDCTTLTQFHIPENVETIGWRVFENCSSLTKFTVAEGNQYFSADELGILYENGGKTLSQVPQAMTGILRVPEGVEEIAGGALDQTQLSEVILPNTVTYLGASIMRNSTATSIYLPVSLTKIHEHAFIHNPKLQQILYEGTKEQWAQIENIEVLDSAYVLYEIPAP